MQNPFTTTFSKIPETYISTEQEREIIDNFSYERPSESVYKITGVRGSGKTVLLAKVEEEFKKDFRKKEGWYVFRISPGRDMLSQLATYMIEEKLMQVKALKASASVSVPSIPVGINITKADEQYSDIGIKIEKALESATQKGKKILIGIDEVSKTDEMLVFALEFSKWLRAGYSIYLVCTGLYENIEQLYNVKNLTFFRRATTIKTEPLNAVKMVETYRRELKIDLDTAKDLVRLTKGYPYAFQELGVLYFKNSKLEKLDRIISDLKEELFAYSYEKIWEEMSEGDRVFCKCLVDKEENTREDILKKLDKPTNYSVYRSRLLKKGIIKSKTRAVSLALPFFAEYIIDYGDFEL